MENDPTEYVLPADGTLVWAYEDVRAKGSDSADADVWAYMQDSWSEVAFTANNNLECGSIEDGE